MESFDFKNQVELARNFEEKLMSIKGKVCLPSNFGKGTKTVEALDSIRQEADNLLRDVRKSISSIKEQYELAESHSDEIEEWITVLSSELVKVEAFGEEHCLPMDSSAADISCDGYEANDSFLSPAVRHRQSVNRRLSYSQQDTPQSSKR